MEINNLYRMFIKTAVFAIASWLTLSSMALSAQIRAVTSPNLIDFSDGRLSGDIIVILGDIAEGDAEKFSQVLESLNEQDRFVAQVVILSQGGIVGEAISIGRIIRSKGIGSVRTAQAFFSERANEYVFEFRDHYIFGDEFRVYLNSRTFLSMMNEFGEGLYFFDERVTCLSACSLIYYAGLERWGGVGVHRSFIDDASGAMNFDEMESSLGESHKDISDYLRSMRVAEEVIDTTLATHSREITLLNVSKDHVYSDIPSYDRLWHEYLLNRCNVLSEDEILRWFFLDKLIEDGVIWDEQDKLWKGLFDATPQQRSEFEQLDAKDNSSMKCKNDELRKLAQERQLE